MEQERNFWLVGGDERQRALARLLREDGHTVHIAGLGEDLSEPLDRALSLAHCVILPLPVLDREGLLHTPLSPEQERLEDVLEWMEPGQLLCGGMVSPSVRRTVEARGLRIFDYYAREECMVANAVPTALPIGSIKASRYGHGLIPARFCLLCQAEGDCGNVCIRKAVRVCLSF